MLAVGVEEIGFNDGKACWSGKVGVAKVGEGWHRRHHLVAVRGRGRGGRCHFHSLEEHRYRLAGFYSDGTIIS